MRWCDKNLGLIDIKIPGGEDVMFFHHLALYPPHSLPGLDAGKIYTGSFKLYNNEDLEKFETFYFKGRSQGNWVKHRNPSFSELNSDLKNSIMQLFEYKKPGDEYAIIKAYSKKGEFIFTLTLFGIYNIHIDYKTKTVNFNYKHEIKDWSKH